MAKVASEHYRSATRYIWEPLRCGPLTTFFCLSCLMEQLTCCPHGDQLPSVTLYVNKEQSVKLRLDFTVDTGSSRSGIFRSAAAIGLHFQLRELVQLCGRVARTPG